MRLVSYDAGRGPRAAGRAPETPTFFAKFPNALAPPGADVALPA